MLSHHVICNLAAPVPMYRGGYVPPSARVIVDNYPKAATEVSLRNHRN